MSGLLLTGRIGATDIPPALTETVPSALPLTAGLEGALSEALVVDVLEAVRTGDMCAMAEPGRAGRVCFAANVALF